MRMEIEKILRDNVKIKIDFEDKANPNKGKIVLDLDNAVDALEVFVKSAKNSLNNADN